MTEDTAEWRGIGMDSLGKKQPHSLSTDLGDPKHLGRMSDPGHSPSHERFWTRMATSNLRGGRETGVWGISRGVSR